MLTRILLCLALLALIPALVLAQTPPTSPPLPPPSPLPGAAGETAPPPVLDTVGNGVGIAQQTAHARGLQARVLWMDAGANVGNLNTPEKIADVVAKTKASGMNMIVLDVKPIVGDTVYPSRFAPKLTAWKNRTVDADFDVLGQMLTAAHAAGLPVYANLSTFGEGHKLVKRGLAYTHPDWQTILYEPERTVSAAGASAIAVPVTDGLPASADTLAALTTTTYLHKDRPGYTVALLNFAARVQAVYDGEQLEAAHIDIPPQGSVLLGSGAGGDWLKQNAPVGRVLTFAIAPRFVSVADAPEQKYTMFVDPNNPEVRQHEWDIVREIATNYAVDGMVFDDRLRYAGQNADFSPRSRAAFEAVVGQRLIWPDDVFRFSPYPGQNVQTGPYYQQWLTWRAGNITSWLTEAARIVRSARPSAQVAVYVGSWYGDYEKVGSNWAGPDFTAPFTWLTPDYRKTAYAGLLDWLTTGCYYEDATLAEGDGTPGATVEGAGQVSNLVVDDAAWTYAGLYALSYQGQPDKFARAITAAGASTQGVMVFDLSQIIDYNWWDVLAQAFAASPAQPPSLVPGLLDTVRAQHGAARAQGGTPPSLPPFAGRAGIGF